jgi:hypothetical protein
VALSTIKQTNKQTNKLKWYVMNKQALEKTENAIKNEQSTHTDNIGH